MKTRFTLLFGALVLIQLGASSPCRATGEIPSELAGNLIFHPDINWWSAARRGQHGKGVFLLTVDRNGEVSEIKVLRSTGYPYLNEIAVKQLFSWRFQPGTVMQAKIPLYFQLKGYFKEIHGVP